MAFDVMSESRPLHHLTLMSFLPTSAGRGGNPDGRARARQNSSAFGL
jgi:hypothetical protein